MSKLRGPITDTDLVRLARALADPTRVRILRTLATCGTLCCGAIGREVPVRPATISHHLRILADAGLVEMRRDGQFINVCINSTRLEQLRESLGSAFNNDRLDSRTRRARARRQA